MKICRVFIREPVIIPISTLENLLDFSGVQITLSLDESSSSNLFKITKKYKEFVGKRRIVAFYINKWIPSSPMCDVAIFPPDEYNRAKAFSSYMPDVKVFVESGQGLKPEHRDNFEVANLQFINEYIQQWLKNDKDSKSKGSNSTNSPDEGSKTEEDSREDTDY
jgi:hypothetical protein